MLITFLIRQINVYFLVVPAVSSLFFFFFCLFYFAKKGNEIFFKILKLNIFLGFFFSKI